MILKVRRIRNNGNATIGELYIDDKFECHTLEDEPRKDKVYGEMRIPAGTYEIELRTEGTVHEVYKKRFPDIHHGTLHVTNIPGFQYVLIHIGNTEKDTAGCLLVGRSVVNNWTLGDSTGAYKQMYVKVCNELLKGNEVIIEYIDLDGGI